MAAMEGRDTEREMTWTLLWSLGGGGGGGGSGKRDRCVDVVVVTRWWWWSPQPV